ncbi:MAG: TonB-dependent receptor, partial [Calditrichia bacterium]|nr:TonB-dependent receptor [Calditrichia bacterium]
HNGEIKELLNLYDVVNSESVSPDSVVLNDINQDYYRYIYDKKYYNFYLMEKGTLFNNKLTWQANVYFQNIDFSFKHRKAGNFESTNLHAYDVNYTHFSPRLGINYNINKNWNSYLSFSTAEKEPNADDLFDKWYGADDLGISPHFAKSDTIYRNGNIDHIKWQDPYVKEEKLIDIEAGVGYRSSLLQTELNLFRMYFKDEIVPFGAVDDDGYDVKGNADETIHEGFELSFYLKRGKHFAFSQNISYSNNYFNKFEQEDLVTGEKKNHSGKTISGFPDWLANTSVYFNYNNFIIKLTERYVGRIYLDNTEDKERSIDPTGKFLIFNPSGDIFNTNNLTEINNYLLDFQMSYKIPNTILKMNTNIILQINNLFNNKYYTAGYYGWDKLNGEYHLTNWMLPAATRNFLLTFRMNM